jgi:phosphoserine phosphatase
VTDKIVCFDFDSTLSKIEGIDELARRVGCGQEMEKLTQSAMNGDLPLEAIYERRLSIIRPGKSEIKWLAQLYIDEMVEGAVEVVKTLQDNGREVHIISGGLRQAILPMAKKLGVADENVHAVSIHYTDDGRYQNYDRLSPLARNGGKAEICKQLAVKGARLFMVGDGNTDLEAKQAGAFFIGFGGVVERKSVRDKADRFVSDSSLLSVLDYLS